MFIIKSLLIMISNNHYRKKLLIDKILRKMLLKNIAPIANIYEMGPSSQKKRVYYYIYFH